MGTKVLFKKGAQADLPASAVAGAFYLTNDTYRLYYGVADGQPPKLLNQTVQFMAGYDALTTATSAWTNDDKRDHVNDIFYLQAENILATWTGTEWKQINQVLDDHITDLATTASAVGSIGTIEHIITDAQSRKTTASFGIEVENGLTIQVATATSGILLKGDEYSLSAGLGTGAATAVATVVLSSENQPSVTSGFSFRAGENMSFSTTGNDIVLTAVDHYNDTATFSLTAPGSLYFSVTDNTSASVEGTVSNIGIVLNDSSFVPLSDTSAKVEGAVYSKSEVDTLIQGLNGMTYKGTLGSGTAGEIHTLPTTGVHVGDTYVVVSSGMEPSSVNSSTLFDRTVIGDMFIATGTEDTNPSNTATYGTIISNLQWTYVPSGNDSLAEVTYSTTITTATNVFHMVNDSGYVVLGVSATGTNGVSVSSAINSSVTNQMDLTITHDTYSTTSTTSNAASGTEFTAISGITVSNGHITAIESKTFTPQNYFLATYGQDAEGQVNGYVASSTTSNASFITALEDGSGSQTSSLINLHSDSLYFSTCATNAQINIDLEWGSF